MGKLSRQEIRKRRQNIIDDDNMFSATEEGRCLKLSFTRVFFVMLYLLFLFANSWMSDCGTKVKELKRYRKPFEEKIDAKLLDKLFQCIYRMSRGLFYKLHSILESRLNEIFLPKGGGKQKKGCQYLIETKLRLSIALGFFAGADPYDLMQIHDVGLVSVFYSVWGVIDAINSTDELKYSFPNHQQQK